MATWIVPTAGNIFCFGFSSCTRIATSQIVRPLETNWSMVVTFSITPTLTQACSRVGFTKQAVIISQSVIIACDITTAVETKMELQIIQVAYVNFIVTNVYCSLAHDFINNVHQGPWHYFLNAEA